MCMFFPFAMKFVMLISESIKETARRRHFASLVLGIPFDNPLKQTLMAVRLALLDPAKKHDKKQIEAVVKDASLNSLYEAMLEAWPQLLIQILVVLSTGEITPVQAFSMLSSLLTQSLTASRGFFVQCRKSYADPEPSPMIFWVFFPMLVLVVSSVISWSTIGLIKEFTALVILIATWLSLWWAEKRGKAVAKIKEAENLELGIVGKTTNRESCNEEEDILLLKVSDDKEGKGGEDFGQVARTNQENGAIQERKEEAERNENRRSTNSERAPPDVMVITEDEETQAGTSYTEERTGEHDLLVLPPSNFREGKAERLAFNWNAKEGVATVTAEEQIWQRGKRAINLATWSDRDCKGELGGLRIRTSSNEEITQIKSLYG